MLTIRIPLITTILATLALSSSSAALAAPTRYDGDVSISADFDREHGEILITGEAAHALYGLIAYRTRIVTLGETLSMALGHGAACYEYGDETTVPITWVYSCKLEVGSFGEIKAPAIPPNG